MSKRDLELDEFENATMEDARYELEGAFEVYGIGRCRFVFIHCRAAMLISIVMLAKERGIRLVNGNIDDIGRSLGTPGHISNSCMAIDIAGRYGSVVGSGADDQELVATILGKTLETFEWMRGEMGKG